jgi:M6 family metalloprotease-like protein
MTVDVDVQSKPPSCTFQALSPRQKITAAIDKIASYILLLLFVADVTHSLAPPHPSFQEWESVHTMRGRLNITYNYDPIHLPNEHCRFLSEEECRKEDEGIGHAKQGKHGRQLSPSVGQNFRVLVVLVRFSDHVARTLPTREYIDELFNMDGTSTINPIGSLKEYLRYASLGKYRVQFDVRDWHTAPNTEAFYSMGQYGLVGNVPIQQMFYSAMDAAQAAGVDWLDGYINEWGLINHLVVIHSGYPAEDGPLACLSNEPPQNRIWSQGTASSPEGWLSPDYYQVNGYAIGSAFVTPSCNGNTIKANFLGLGVIQHEYLHGFGLYDLYDIDKDEVEKIAIGGTGRFDIMSNALGWDRNVSVPGHMSPFSRLKVDGWLEPILITVDGFYAVQPSEISAHVYKITHNFPSGEYLLLENRQPIKWDKNWQGSGIVIYHVDETKVKQSTRGYPGKAGWPADHYMVSVLQADGLYDIEKGKNLGDAGDFWVKGMVIGPGPNFPNTDSIQGGIQKPTGIKITIRSNSGFIMTFQVEGITGTTLRDGDNPSFTIDSPVPDRTGTVLAWIISLLGGIAALIGVLAIVL